METIDFLWGISVISAVSNHNKFVSQMTIIGLKPDTVHITIQIKDAPVSRNIL
jgi:hypothetical protein